MEHCQRQFVKRPYLSTYFELLLLKIKHDKETEKLVDVPLRVLLMFLYSFMSAARKTVN